MRHALENSLQDGNRRRSISQVTVLPVAGLSRPVMTEGPDLLPTMVCARGALGLASAPIRVLFGQAVYYDYGAAATACELDCSRIFPWQGA